MRCLITGIGGFTGKHLARLLGSTPGVEVFGIDSPARQLAPTSTLLCTDLRDQIAIPRFVRCIRPDAILHLAGKTRGDSLEELLAANVETTRVLLELAAELGCLILVPGSAAEYGHPTSLPLRETHPLHPVTPYGISKARQTALAQEYARRGVTVLVPRPFNLIGPGQPASFICAQLARRVASLAGHEPLEVANPDTRRDFVDVRDVARGYWEILTRGRPGEVYHLCTGQAPSLEEVSRLLLGAAGRPALLRCGAQTDPPEAATFVGSAEKIQAELGWSPRILLADSLREMLEEHRRLVGVRP